MRNLVTTITAVILMFSSSVLKASESISVEIYDFSVIGVTLSSTIEGEKLYLKDYDGTILFNTTLDKLTSYKKYFNLSEVENGIYFVETQTATEIKVTPIVKSNTGVALITNSTETIFKPEVELENKLLSFSFRNTVDKPVTIKVLDKESIILHEEADILDTLITRKYDLSTIPAGAYYIYVTQNGKSFYEEVVIK